MMLHKSTTRKPTNQQGFSLLELLVATTFLALIVTSVTVVLRNNVTQWREYRGAQVKHESAHGVLRHLVRQIRQASSVTTISGSSDSTGTLELVMADGTTNYVWSGDGSDVYFGEDTASTLLGNDIAELTITGFEGDGVTETSTVEDIQLIRCKIGYDNPERTPTRQQIESYAWIRTF